MRIPVRVLLAVFLFVSVVPSMAAGEEAPGALAWQHEGFASLAQAATQAKAQGKRLLLGLSGGST